MKQPQTSRTQGGFTIVELIIAIVVIAILAGIIVLAYNGITRHAREVSLMSDLDSGASSLALHMHRGQQYPTQPDGPGFTPSDGNTVEYFPSLDRKGYCLTASHEDLVYSIVDTDRVPVKGTCEGYIRVPGIQELGTTDFWVMKYEAKDVGGVATSQADGTPWVSLAYTSAMTLANDSCGRCHLLSEKQWMTIAANVLLEPSNWSGGAVGSGYIFSGHNDNSPTGNLAASTNDTDGYSGTGNTTGNQRRTLKLLNGETIWDLAGNVWEWTATSQAMNNVGVVGDSTFVWRQWTNGSLSTGNLPAAALPSALASVSGLSGVTSWSAIQGIGQIYANYSDTATRASTRGGARFDFSGAGVLALGTGTGTGAGGASTWSGFRVAR